jgi:hypothetical protein
MADNYLTDDDVEITAGAHKQSQDVLDFNYVSRVRMLSLAVLKEIQNEMRCGDIFADIPGSADYCSTIEWWCQVNLAEIIDTNTLHTLCRRTTSISTLTSLLEKSGSTTIYISTASRKLGDVSMLDQITGFMINKFPVRKICRIILDSILHSLQSANILCNASILHGSINDRTIQYDVISGFPVLVDFGNAHIPGILLSPVLSKIVISETSIFKQPILCKSPYANITISELRARFLPIDSEDCYYQCMDVLVIRSILNMDNDGIKQNMSAAMDDIDADELIAMCISYMKQYGLFSKNLFSKKEMDDTFTSLSLRISSLVDKTWIDIIAEFMKTWRTWDIYSICASYLLMIRRNMNTIVLHDSIDDNYSDWLELCVDILKTKLLSIIKEDECSVELDVILREQLCVLRSFNK